jgi:hypothetical protein
MAFGPRLAAALSGTTTGQLAYWRRTGVLEPGVSFARPVLYSFPDLIALRTFAYLRGQRSLQKSRVAVRSLETIGATSHLSSYRLVPQEPS